MIVNVIDDRMGMSKTSAMIEYMKKYSNQKKFIFVTPFLDEVERVKKSCGFIEPLPSDKFKNKTECFKALMLSNISIVTTHSLFKSLDEESIDILREKDYVLVLDEVLDVVSETSLTETSLIALVDLKILKILEDGNIVAGEEEVLRKYVGDWEYEEIINNLLRKNLEFYRSYENKSKGKKYALMWLFPIDLLKSFDEIFILTYCFDGYPLKSFLDLHGIKQQKFSVEVINPEAEYEDRQYKFVPYFLRSNKDIKDKVKILDGNVINNIGEENGAFSMTWYSNKFTKNELGTQLRKNLLNVACKRFKNNKIKDILWTTFKNKIVSLTNEKLKDSNYIPHNLRATNEYRDRTSLIYLVNRNYNPVIYQWFKGKGITVDEKTFAIGEMCQWVWRSAIRDNKEIEIYIPSSKMRTLFTEWLNQ